MKYAIEMGSGSMIYVPSFMKIGGFTDTHTHRQHGDLISLLLFFHNKKSMLKTQKHY
jgi:hypothetical protein